MGRGKKQGTPQIRKLTGRQKAQAQVPSNGILGKRKVVKNGIVKWIPIRKPE